MTEEQLPTRRSLRIAREAEERAKREARLQAELNADTPPQVEPVKQQVEPVEVPAPTADLPDTGSVPRRTSYRELDTKPAAAPTAAADTPVEPESLVTETPTVAAASYTQFAPESPIGSDFDADSTHAGEPTSAADNTATYGADTAAYDAAATTQAYGFDGPAVHEAPLNFDDIVIERDADLAHARRRRGHRVAKAVALSLVGLLTFTTAGVAAVYQRLTNNMDVINVGGLVQNAPGSTFEPPNDPNAGEALNYLIIGVDDRTGANGKLTDRSTGGSRSDTTMIMHISKNRKRIEVVSIPRDSMVNIPSCQLTNGNATGATFGMFNNAYAYGYDQGGDYESAIACTWRTVQENAGVKIDGAILIDFAGFAGVVDAIGGVYMCIPEETISEDAGKLHLQAGWQTLKGKDALNYARARKGTGQNFDGSDLTRTGRQQQMIAAIFSQVMDEGVLSNPTKLFSLADATTKTLTVTDTLSDTTDLVGLGYSLRNIRSKNITFMTIPYEAYPADRNRVQWSAEADIVWQNMSDDRPIISSKSSTDTVGDGSGTGAGTANDGAGTEGSDSSVTNSEPEVTKIPGREAFTADETTAVCVSDAPKKGK